MGLLKGSRIQFTEGEAIIGDEIITPLEEASLVVPQAPEAESPVEGEEGAWELDEVALPEESALADEALVAPFADYETVREHLIDSAGEAANLEAQAFAEALQGAAPELMQQRLDEAREALEAANPEGDFEGRVMPYVQRQVAAELELEFVGTVSETRWTHLQRIEEKIQHEVGEVAAEIEERHPPETFAELLARREEVLSEARLMAERITLAAQTRGAELIAQAEQLQAQTMAELEAERERILAELREQAYADGYNEGKAAGEAEAARFLHDALQKFNEMVVAFPTAVKQNEEKLVSLALEIASKVIQEEISLQPEIVQRTVETALKRVSDLEQVVVKVNPLDLDLILPKQDTFRALVPDVQSFSIEGSHTIQRGGCIIETNSGSINATIATQLSIVEEVMRNVREEYEDEVLGEIT
ncbi:MAG TPA: FliH/SctL family protein [Oscillatoriaceae cyanobacterium]